MCRESLPVWQSFSETYPSVRIVGVSLGADSEPVKLYTDAARVEFPILLDRKGGLARVLGFQSVRNVLLYGPGGFLEYVQAGAFDLRDQDCLEMISAWAEGNSLAESEAMRDPEAGEVAQLFASGTDLYERGHKEGALETWRKALALSPNNVIVRDQVWSVEEPDRFYRGRVDEAWKRRRGASE